MPDIDKERLNKFLKSVPNLSALQHKNADMCAYFAFFLIEMEGFPSVAPRDIQGCYDASDIKSPANIPATLRQSKAFIRAPDKRWRLERQYKESIAEAVEAPAKELAAGVPAVPATSAPAVSTVIKKKIFVIHGRNERLRRALFEFLLSIRLDPIEWDAAVQMTNQGSPYIGDIIKAGFGAAQAFVVLFTPDELASLIPELRKSKADAVQIARPRPNVLLEAGMALAIGEQRTLIVQIGNVGEISDIAGRHVLRLDNSPERRQALVTRLRTAGCDVVNTGTDWLTAGDFENEKESKK